MRKRYKFKKMNRTQFKRHRHAFKVGSMRGLTSIPLRYRGKRI